MTSIKAKIALCTEGTPSSDTIKENQRDEKEKDLEGIDGPDISSGSGKKRIVLILCSTAMFTTSCAGSVIAPFYPQEAQDKGMSLTMIAIVFGIHQLLIFLASPVIGSYITKVGVKFSCVMGIFIGGTCTICFGVLDKSENETWFGVMCILCRSLEAFGSACFIISTITILSNEFPGKMGRVSAVIQTSSTVGYMVGPVIGGCLYDLGGFGLPLYCIGGCILLNGGFIYKLLPVTKEVVKDKGEKSIAGLLYSPKVVFSWFSVYLGAGGTAMFDSLYAIHIASFGLSATALGGIFIIGSFSFALSAPAWGYFSDMKNTQGPLLVLGHFVFGFSFWMNGPSPLLPFIPFDLWTNIVSYVLRGIGLASLNIVSMKYMMIGACESNYEANIETRALVSSLYNSGYSCGGFCGSLLGGFSVQQYGFSITYTTFGIMNFCLMIVLLLYVFSRCSNIKQKRINSEKMPLDPSRVLCE